MPPADFDCRHGPQPGPDATILAVQGHKLVTSALGPWCQGKHKAYLQATSCKSISKQLAAMRQS